MSNKIIVAKSGYNVLTDHNPDHLIFSSDYNTLKYYASGFYQMVTSSPTTFVIAHNLGYVPFHIVYCNDFGFNPSQYAMTEYFNTFGGFRAARAYCDATNLYLSSNSSGATFTINWYYKIFKNSLNL